MRDENKNLWKGTRTPLGVINPYIRGWGLHQMHIQKWLAIAAWSIFLFYPLIYAATTATTTFVFNVPTTRSLTITYGGNCSTTAFFFNEIDAIYDPDADGNASKVKPNATRPSNSTIYMDFNFVGNGSPADNNIVYRGMVTTGKPPPTNTTPSNEMALGGYTSISTDNGSVNSANTTTVGETPTYRMVFKSTINKQLIQDFNFFFNGSATSVGDQQTCDGASSGGSDLNIFIWNYAAGQYEHIIGTNAGGAIVAVDGYSLAAIRAYDIPNYVSADNNVTFLVQGHTLQAGEGQSCLNGDYANLRITYYATSTTFCQSSTLAPMTITNTGNVDINVDGNFTSAFTGVDINIILKAWMGDGTGCGADGNGLGGWENNCSATGTTSPVTQTTCKEWNQTNATTGSRLTTKLLVGDTNQLCFSGDFNAVVSPGDHNKTFQTGGAFS